MPKPITKTRLKPENTRQAMRRVEVTEDRCLVCGVWVVRTQGRRQIACSPYHRTKLYRLHARGERGEFE